METNTKNNRIMHFNHDLYLIADADNNPHWYHGDPLVSGNRDANEVEIGQAIFELMGGSSDIVNPYLVRILVCQKRRGEAFDPSALEGIRRGENDLQVKDLDGNVVEITKRQSDDRMFPLNGVIYDEHSGIKYTRSYSLTGMCADENMSHRLVIMKSPVDPEEK